MKLPGTICSPALSHIKVEPSWRTQRHGLDEEDQNPGNTEEPPELKHEARSRTSWGEVSDQLQKPFS